jgi:hypothetical protein
MTERFLSGEDITGSYCHPARKAKVTDKDLKREVFSQSFQDVMSANICSKKFCRFDCHKVK